MAKSFKILVLGLAGSGKTELVNNLLGEEKKTTSSVTYGRCVSGRINQMTVLVYDSPGLGDISVYSDDSYLAEIGEWIPKVDATICCIKMNETRLNERMIQMFDQLTKIGIEWRKVLFALTFADAVSASTKLRQAPEFDSGMFFNNRFEEWKQEITNVLKRKVGPQQVEQLRFCPTNDDPDSLLLNGETWLNALVTTLIGVAELENPDEYHELPCPIEIHNNNSCPCCLL